MKLVKASVRNFRCIDDSTAFTIPQASCLVGKNESGRSTLLLAIERLNPFDASRANFDKLLDYPRKHLADYDERHSDYEAKFEHPSGAVTWVNLDPQVERKVSGTGLTVL